MRIRMRMGTKIRIIRESKGITEINFCFKCRINYSAHRNKQATCPICKKGRIDGHNLLSPGNIVQCIVCESITSKITKKMICHNKCNI